ncbi:MAG TPA: alpha/beta hydrolase [Candidatus Choladousia intestinigallinarum]|nr:alpha/beta hydrolase [Candidatus Choladousia intestinigallinarum]
MDRTYCNVKNTYISLSRGQGGIFYEPVDPALRKETGILLMHSDSDYYGFIPAPELASRGFTVLASNVEKPCMTLDKKLLDVKRGVEYLRKIPGLQRVVLLGHSGGATLMSAYQCVAENGPEIFQDDRKIVKLSDIGPLPKADAVMFLDSNWGNGVMTLLSLEPGISDNATSRNLKPGFDLFAPENGFSPEGADYSPEFIRNYQRGQEKRNEELIGQALERLGELEQDRGRFEDDEPFVIAGASQIAPNNKMFPQDTKLLSHTIHEWPLIHEDGSVTREVIYSLRKPHFNKNMVTVNEMATNVSTVKTYLTNSAVRTRDFHYDESRIYGIDWDSSYCCTPGNVKGISSPMLIMGMTGSYEFLAAEAIYENAKSEDKTMAFVRGASHNFTPQQDAESYPGEFGDTVKNCFDYVGKWLDELVSPVA